ncbi:competence protein ComK [Rummeliibacillus pycnus]|uniref:competence protein ComK n=1 Tax=Rummeliibacillus pycnus TaxID=101070 RepID=UPI000C9CE263|nr:competence protein ComK [Rummeliibacillus pycnus]
MVDEIYTVNENTMAFIPFYDGEGKIKTNILEVEDFKDSQLTPIELVDRNLRFFGSSLKGASEGTRYVLGEVNMYPVIMNLKHQLVWFPTISPKKNDCVWLALNHIKSYKKNKNQSTEILFTNGSSLTIEVRFSSFDRRINRACALKFRLDYRSKFMLIPPSVQKNFLKYSIIKDDNDINYQIHTKNEDSLDN